MTGQALQFAGSLAAILALAWLVRRLGMGHAQPLDSEDKARRAASEVEDGFEPVACTLDDEGRAALLRDAAGRIMVLRAHGAHFAGRILQHGADARIMGSVLIVDPAERQFGAVSLHIEDPEVWGKAIHAL